MKHDYSVDFDVFWQAFPNHTAKLAAAKAYLKARRTASAEDLLDGIARYIAAKPEWQDFCHASTWLNGERWNDEVAAPARQPQRFEYVPWVCPHTPECRHRAGCVIVSLRKAVASEWWRRR